jgi:nucleotide sugar dehydrogenase
MNNCSIIFTFIQTPSLDNGSYNHSFIDNFINYCCDYCPQEEKIILINSTVMPEFSNSIQESLLNNDCNCKIVYNPSFIAQGSIFSNINNPDFILLGYDNYKDENDTTLNKIIDIYDKIIDNKSTNDIIYNKMTLFEAEITKLAINCYITSKISYANLIGDLVKTKGYNPNVVLNAMGCDNRIGNKCMDYGFGYGGPSLLRDNKALFYYSSNNKIQINNCFVNDDNNKKHLDFQFNELISTKGPVEFKFITYKDDSDILEQSQKLELAVKLAYHKKEVIIYERPFIIKILRDLYGDLFTYKLYLKNCIN